MTSRPGLRQVGTPPRSFGAEFLFNGSALVALLVALLVSNAFAQTSFEDVSAAAGVDYSTESYGVSAGDINGDGLLDFFLSNHRERPSLLLNRNGTFYDTSQNVRTWINRATADTHGGSFADFDNDGDQDLLISVGTGNPSQFFVNDFGAMLDRTDALGVSFDSLGGRLPVWLDYDGDGLLDFIMSNFGGAAKLFRQTATGFIESTVDVGLLCLRFQYGQLYDVNDDDRLDFICPEDAVYPQKVYDTMPLPWGDLTNLFPPVAQVPDSIIADFDNDQRPDIFLLSNVQLRPSSVLQSDSNTIDANLTGGEKGFNFVTDGHVTFDLGWNKLEDGLGLPRIRIGAIEFNPFQIPFTLDPADPNVAGLPASDPASAPLMRIGFDPATNRWTVIAQTENIFSEAYYVVTSDQVISDVKSTGLWGSDYAGVPTLLLNKPGGFIDSTDSSLLNTPIQCGGVTAGDYDNDMDVDLYLVCRTGVENISNIYYDNQGDGTFIAVAAAGGAEGPVGSAVTSGAGTADSVISADYDADGFLDLLVTNGFNLRPSGFGGPTKLYRNLGNVNGWIQIDLVAANTTARDAVGARVTATANSVTQVRVFDGGYHRWSQEPTRMHFGLGSATTVDLVVDWPSGLQEIYQDVAANQILKITEGVGIATVVPGAGPPYSCGLPTFDPASDFGIFVWRDCYDDVWRVRLAGGGASIDTFAGTVVSPVPLVQVDPVGLEAADLLESISDPRQVFFEFTNGGGGTDGFNVRLADAISGCFALDTLTPTPVFYGPFRSPVATSFDLKSAEACELDLIKVGVGNAAAGEADGQIDFNVSLSTASLYPVTVDVTTVDGTAVAGSDYVLMPTTTVTFDPGEIAKVVSVTLVDDVLGEGEESFSLQLSNPIGAILAGLEATATISDDEVSACGEPVFDPASEQGVFMWKDCVTGDWFVRMTSGGSSSVVIYNGSIISNSPFAQVIPFSNESNDILDSATDPLQIAYSLRMINAGVDGIDISAAAGSTLCFELDAPAAASVLVGTDRIPAVPPFDMNTLQDCGGLLPVLSVSASPASEIDAQVDFVLSLSEASPSDVSVEVATEDGSAEAGLDYSAIPATTVTFAAGETSQIVTVPLLDDSLAEGDEQFRLVLSAPSNATIGTGNATVTILDDELSPCGEPTINAATEAGVFLWRDCGGAEWHLRVTGGGVFTRYQGQLLTSVPFAAVNGFSIETSDTLAVDSQGLAVDFVLEVSGGGSDGMDFRPAATANTCFSLDLPGSAAVFVGQNKNSVGQSFDLDTLGPCAGLPPTVGAADQVVSETDGSVVIAVSLSAASGDPITVDIQTADGSARASEDYLAVIETVTIPAGQLSQDFVLTLLDDALAEGTETLTLELSDPSNATLDSATANLTINDDEISPCGEPSYSSSTEPGVFLWRECPSGQWRMRASAGGVFTTYSGLISSTGGFSQISGFSLEANDMLDLSQTNNAEYQLIVSGGGQDGVDFTPAPVSAACFYVDAPAGAAVYVGSSRTPLMPPFDLATLTSCGQLPALRITDAVVTEAETAVFTVSLSFPVPEPVSVDYQTADGLAVAPGDYADSGGTLTIPAGISSVTINIATVDDATDEPQEDFTLLLSNPLGAVLIGDRGVGTIIDNDSVSVSVDSVVALETDANMTFTVSLSAPSEFDVTVDYSTSDQSATAGNDYVPLPLSTLAFAAGEVSKSIDVALLDDIDIEGDESFALSLSNPFGAGLGTAVGVGTITDSEPLPVIDIVDGAAPENAGIMEFLVTLSATSTQPVTVDFTTADGTAEAGLDYLAVASDTLTFAPGEAAKPIAITLLDDTLTESTEVFSIVLGNPTRASIGLAAATGTITDNESVPVVSVADVTVNEDDALATIEAVLSIPSQVEVRVDYVTSANTATAPDDFSAVSGTLVFAPGATVTNIEIPIVDDLDLEFAETFLVVLSNPVDSAIGTGSAVVTIDDDEAVVCGEPSYDPSAERLIVVWRDCLSTGDWHVRAMVGFDYLSYSGRIESNQGFQSVTGFNIEANDFLEFSADPSAIIYTLGMIAPGIDGIDFSVYDDATVCFNTSLGPGATIIAGADRTPVASSSFDLQTLGPCDMLPVLSASNATPVENQGSVSVAVNLSAPSATTVTVDFATVAGSATADQDFVSVGGTLIFEPGETSKYVDVTLIDDIEVELDETFTLEFTRAVNASFGVASISATASVTLTDDEVATAFVVEDITVSETDLPFDFLVTLTVPATEAVTVDVRSIDSGALAGIDYVAVPLTTLTFGIGETSKAVPITLLDDGLAEGLETFRIELSNATGLPIAQPVATVSIIDDEPSPCGEPTLDTAIDAGLFIWKNCADGTWDARVLAGPSFKLFTGRVSSSDAFSVVNGVDIETSDLFDFVSNPSVIDFSLRVGAGYFDGFNFQQAPGASTCVSLDSPTGINAYLGADKTLLTLPVDLDFLNVCTP